MGLSAAVSDLRRRRRAVIALGRNPVGARHERAFIGRGCGGRSDRCRLDRRPRSALGSHGKIASGDAESCFGWNVARSSYSLSRAQEDAPAWDARAAECARPKRPPVGSHSYAHLPELRTLQRRGFGRNLAANHRSSSTTAGPPYNDGQRAPVSESWNLHQQALHAHPILPRLGNQIELEIRALHKLALDLRKFRSRTFQRHVSGYAHLKIIGRGEDGLGRNTSNPRNVPESAMRLERAARLRRILSVRAGYRVAIGGQDR